MAFRTNDLVRIKAAWRDASEPDEVFVVRSDEQGGRVDISPVQWDYRIVPVETVASDTLIKA